MNQLVKKCGQSKPEQGKISLWLIAFLGLSPIVVFILVAVVMYWPQSSSSSSSSPKDIKQEIIDISKGGIGNYVEISNVTVTEDGKTYSIEIKLLSEEADDEQAEKWTKTVCEQCSAILENHEREKDISVQAIHGETILGTTLYSKGKYKYKKFEPPK